MIRRSEILQADTEFSGFSLTPALHQLRPRREAAFGSSRIRFEGNHISNSGLHTSLVTLARLPLKKFAKQFFPFGVAHRHTRLMAHEGVEVASLLRFLLLLGLDLLQHVFGHAKPSPAGYRGRQIYVAPFRMIGRVLQRVPTREQILDETADLRIAL